MKRLPLVGFGFVLTALLTGCGQTHKASTSTNPGAPSRACLNAKQLATLEREIRTVTIKGDKEFAFRSMGVFGGCYGQGIVTASIAHRQEPLGEFEHITISRDGKILSTVYPMNPAGG